MSSVDYLLQLTDAKKKADETQIEVEEIQGAKRKLDKEAETLQERIEELMAENNKIARSKKKLQEEVRSGRGCLWEWEEMWVGLCGEARGCLLCGFEGVAC